MYLFSNLIYAAGAEIIEKHVGFEKQKKGLDIKFSAKGREIRDYKDKMIKSFDLLGKSYFFRNLREKQSKKYRRSIFIVDKIKKGERVTKNNIKILRPSIGLDIKYYNKILGKKSKKNFDYGDIPSLKNFKL